MAARPSSPTSLLWAHQLKREHGFLLQRMQDLEAKNESQEARIKTAESAAKSNSNSEIAELAEQVKALNEAGMEKRIANMERDVAEKLDDVQAESEAHTLQIASLQNAENMAEEERRKAVSKDKALLKRIGEVEEGLQKYEKSLDRMGKRLDETRFEQIKGQLDGLTKQVQREGEQMKWLTESINALEAANAELIKASEKLETELSKMAAKAASAEKKKSERTSAANVQVEPPAKGGAEQEQPKKKSHKWAGGGADRDIIRMGSDLFGTPSTVQRSPHTATKEPPKKKPAPPGPKKKPQPPLPNQQRITSSDSSGTPKKSHRWAGGGADKDIIQAGIFQGIDAKRRRSSENFSEAPKKKPHKWAGGGADKEIIQAGSSPASNPQPSHRKEIAAEKPKQSSRVPAADGDEVIVRAGKGWIEVADTQSGGSNVSTSAPPVKRKRGRPRKENFTPQFTDEELTQGRVTRRGIQQQPNPDMSLVNEILGNLQYAPMAQEILRVDPSIPREKLERLKKIFEEDPRARTDVAALTEGLKLGRQPANKKRTADSAFGAAAQNAAATGQTLKKIKREESPDSTTASSTRHEPNIYSCPVSSPAPNMGPQSPERKESKAPVFAIVTSQPEEAPPKPRRQIVQLDDW